MINKNQNKKSSDFSSRIKEIATLQGINKVIYTPANGLIIFLSSFYIDIMDILKIKGICEKWKISFTVIE